MKKLYFLIISILFNVYSYGAYLTNVPITLTQPDGTVINCFATGDEFYNWVHDSLGYTIVQNPTSGYYHYAILDNDSLVCSNYIVGTVSPTSVNLQPRVNISGEKIREIVNSSPLYQNNLRAAAEQNASGTQTRSNTGALNNIVIYIRFAGEPDFSVAQGNYQAVFQNSFASLFNSTVSGDNSMRNYFREVSYNKLDIVSYFYPQNDGTTILSYKDEFNRGYYQPYNAVTNPDGYQPWEPSIYRGLTLLTNAIESVKNQIPSSLNLDFNNDTLVDNVCFIIRGYSGVDYLHPHKGTLANANYIIGYNSYINGIKVGNYTLQSEFDLLYYIGAYGNQVLCHEMFHTLGAPDLYHCNYDGGTPVGNWDLMASYLNPPQHMGAYIKHKYGVWISSITKITTSGTYTLQPLTSSTNNCYKISIKGSSQYIVLEYRKKMSSVFESNIPGSGLIIYRIDESYFPNGNRFGEGYGGKKKDEVYIFRPNGTLQNEGNVTLAHFSDNENRTMFGNNTNPHCFTAPDGDNANIFIKNIRENPNGTLSFDVRFCDNNNITYSNTSNLPVLTNASNNIQTTGTVIVKSTDNVTFEAGNKVTLNPGFKVELGGIFKVDMNDCGEK